MVLILEVISWYRYTAKNLIATHIFSNKILQKSDAEYKSQLNQLKSSKEGCKFKFIFILKEYPKERDNNI